MPAPAPVPASSPASAASAPRVRRLRARTRQGLRTTAIAVAAVACLTASQAPGLTLHEEKRPGGPAADREGVRGVAPERGPYAELAPPGDGSYHTELPPLTASPDPGGPSTPAAGRLPQVRAESGIPATVLRAYRTAETSVGRTDPGCRLPWELLAAIGKVESGQARGGAVDRAGTTLGRITGPPLDGRGFALIRDTDGGAHDGDTVYDRAVGPMQFLPSTWARWGADGNGDGRADPNNIFDAALAAGHYLCAGDRDLGRSADLDRAILSYNYSRSYLDLVRYWLEFYRRGAHTVPDGQGTVPTSPGAGGDTPATRPVDGPNGGTGGAGGGGIIIGPDPAPSASGGPAPSPSSRPPSPSPSSPSSSPSPGPTPSVTPTGGPEPSGTPGGTPGPDPTGSPTAEPSPTPSATDPGGSTPTPPQDCPSASERPSPEGSAQPAASGPDPATSLSDPCSAVPVT
ncbi:lytic transglycosylase domain-containing protein [Streptomyces sp. CRN 30]|uniref:lytic transglycosylase domain-containing protein n=1 Tax=Streptomyces sp. CRN 30 TaxID=3075613 RepID=UPI002A836563|nr:lytic murein transglycosylase [Streptomyces sp. CRN 30]